MVTLPYICTFYSNNELGGLGYIFLKGDIYGIKSVLFIGRKDSPSIHRGPKWGVVYTIIR
jgi:hypothetical protein